MAHQQWQPQVRPSEADQPRGAVGDSRHEITRRASQPVVASLNDGNKARGSRGVVVVIVERRASWRGSQFPQLDLPTCMLSVDLLYGPHEIDCRLERGPAHYLRYLFFREALAESYGQRALAFFPPPPPSPHLPPLLPHLFPVACPRREVRPLGRSASQAPAFCLCAAGGN